MVRAFALQSVDLEFNPLVESYQKSLKNGIHSIILNLKNYKMFWKKPNQF